MSFVFAKVLVCGHLKSLVLLLTVMSVELVGSHIAVPTAFESSPHHELDDDYEYFENYTNNLGTEDVHRNFTVNCGFLLSKCGSCEYCFYGICKPVEIGGVFHENCSLINTCEEHNTCGDNQCIPSFGKSVCVCPPQWFGEKCQYRAKKEGDKIISRVMVVYSPHTLPLEPARVLVTWLDSSPGSGDTHVVYTVTSPDHFYKNKITFDRFRFNLRTSPLTTCLSNFEDKFKQYCHVLPDDNSFTVLLFSTEYPYLPGYGGRHIYFGSQSRRGYTPMFSISIFTTIGETLQEVYHSYHETMVYYSHFSAYNDICFPLDINLKNPCVANPGYKDPNFAPVVEQAFRKDLIDLTPFLDFKEVHCALTASAKIWKDDDNFDESKTPMISLGSDQDLKILPYTLNPGKYKVKLTVNTINLKFRAGRPREKGTNFIFCWIYMMKLPLIANIKGGALRTVYVGLDLVLDASSSTDPNYPSSRQQHLFYRFRCNETDSFCKTFDTKIPKYVIKAPIRAGVTFDFILTVYAFNSIPSSYEQMIITTNISYASFSIVCLKNCGGENEIINPDKALYLLATAKKAEEHDFTWSYSFTGHEKNGSKSADHLSEGETYPYVKIIKPNALMEGRSYTFTVTRSDPGGEASISIVVGKRPTLGCSIFPHSGKALYTVFRISCSHTSSEPVVYRFYCRDKSQNTLPIYLGNSDRGTLSNTLLFYENVFITTMTVSGCTATFEISVTLREPEWLSDQLRALNHIDLYEEGVDFWKEKGEGSINSITYLVLTFGNHSVLGWNYLMGVIEENYKSKTPTSTYDYLRLLSILTKIILTENVPPITGDHGSRTVSIAKIVNDLIINFSNYDTFFCNDTMVTDTELAEIATSLFFCQRGFFDSLIYSVDDIKSFNIKLMKERYMYGRSGVMKDENPWILEKAANVEITEENSLYGRVKNLTKLMTLSAMTYLQSLSVRLLPMESPFFILNDNYSVFVAVDLPEYLVYFNKLPPGSSKSFVSFDKALAVEIQTDNKYINLEMFVSDHNPYWWDLGETMSINTQLLFVRLVKVMDIKISRSYIYTFSNPLNVYLNVKQWNSLNVSGESALPQNYSHPRDKDLSVTVYQITPQFPGNGKLFVNFTEILPKPSLRVILSHEIRPDYEFMMERARVITNPEAGVTLTYRVDDKNVFLYIGILPGPLYSAGESVKFSFKTSNVRCLVRSRHSVWIPSQCIVAYNTNPELIHCQCFMINFIGAEISVPTLHLSTVKNLSYSRGGEVNVLPPLCAIIFLFLFAVMFFWARNKEKYEHVRDNVIVLEDNFPGEQWAYLVGVYTGCRFSSGTSSRVGIRLMGTSSCSRAHVLSSSRKKTLQTYTDDWFILYTTKHLGDINTLHIWLDYTGRSPSWYCRKIVVYDWAAQKTYSFRLGVWFYIDRTRYLVELQMLPQPSQPPSLYCLLMDNFAWSFQEWNYAIGITHHHPRSFVSLTEKVAAFWAGFSSVALLLLLYYKYDGGVEDYYFYSFSLKGLLIASVTYIPSVFIMVVVQLLFKKKINLLTTHKNVWNEVAKRLQRLEHNYEKATQNFGVKVKKEKSEKVSSMRETNIEEGEPKEAETKYRSEQLPLSIFDESLHHVQVYKRQLYTAWTIVLMAIGVFCFLIILEGVWMGPVKSYVWLSTLFLANFAGLAIFNTLYIVIRILISTFYFKRQCDEPAVEVDPNLGMRLELMGNQEYLDKLRVLRAGPAYQPLRHSQIIERKSKVEKCLSLKLLLEFLFILLIYNLVFFNAMNGWSDSDFYTSQHLKTLIENDVTGLTRLKQLDGFFKRVLSSVFTKTEWYNTKPISEAGDRYETSGWVADYASRMIGVVQLRQKRSLTVNCMPKLLRELFPHWTCVPMLARETEDVNDYDVGWSIPTEDISKTLASPWLHQSKTVRSAVHYALNGLHYSTGGYVVNLRRDQLNTLKILGKMDDGGWISKLTRVVFIDSCVFNPNTGKLSIISTCLQIRPTTGIDHRIQVLSASAVYDDISQFVFRIFLFVTHTAYITTLCISIIQNGTIFFTSFWNCLDLTIAFLSAVCFSCSMADFLYMIFSLQDHLDTGREDFYTHGWLGYHDNIYKSVYILLVICCSTRLFKHLVITLQVIPILRTLRAVSIPIYKILILVLPILYLQFKVLEVLLFNPQLTIGRFPLVNKVGLERYAKQFVFPERKFEPFLYCQFCTIVIAIFTVLIAYHYRIERNRLIHHHDGHDIVQVMRRIFRQRRRLRGGSDFSDNALTACSSKINDFQGALRYCNKTYQHQHTNCFIDLAKSSSDFSSDRKEKVDFPQDIEILKRIDDKLDKILNSLRSLKDNL